MNPDLNTSEEKKELTDEQAQALLAINSLQVSDNQKNSKSFLLFVISVTVVVLVLCIFLSFDNNKNAKSSGSASSTTTNSSNNPFTSSGTVNQQVQYCSNPINAQTSC